MNDPAAPTGPAPRNPPSLVRTIAENPGAALAVAFAIGALCTTVQPVAPCAVRPSPPCGRPNPPCWSVDS